MKKRVRIAAIESETSVSEWIERAVVRELERREVKGAAQHREASRPAGVQHRGSASPTGRGDLEALIEAAVRDREGLYLPPAGSRPKGIDNPIKPGGGKTMAETIIEERGER